MIKWVVLVVGSSSIKTDFSCIQNQSCIKYECNRTVVKYHDAEISVIQSDYDENNEKYKFEVCSITKLKEDGVFHFDGTDLESFMGKKEPDLRTYDIELRNRTTKVQACKEENGVFCTGRKCNARIQAIFDKIKNPCFTNERSCARFEPVRDEIPYNFDDILEYKSDLHRKWLKCLQLTSPRLSSKSDLVSSCYFHGGIHKPSDPQPPEYWKSYTIVPEIDWIENENSPKLCSIGNSFKNCKEKYIQEYHTPMVGIYQFNSRGFCKELSTWSPCPDLPEYKFVCRYDNCNNYTQYSTAEWYSIPDCKQWDNWPEYNQHKWPSELINLKLNKTEKFIPLRKVCGKKNSKEKQKYSNFCKNAINQKFICANNDKSKTVTGNFCSNNTNGAINWSEFKSLPKMSISNQTEACYLNNRANDKILICRGDFCLSSIIGGGGDHIISSCETTVLELEEKSSTGMVNNLSPLYITLLIIIFIILFLAIVIMIMKQRSKNRNNSDNNYNFAPTSRCDDNQRSFCQINTPGKHVENAIRKTTRDCYPTAKSPAYEKQLFIFESNVKETELYNLEDVATQRRNLSELLENEIEIRHSRMLMESIISRVETYFVELLIDRCKPYQLEIRSNHVLVDDENQIFVKLIATERKSSSSSDQAVAKIKSDLIAILEKILKKTQKAPTSSSPRVSEESTGKSSSGYSTGGSNDEESSRLLSPTQGLLLGEFKHFIDDINMDGLRSSIGRFNQRNLT